MRRKFSKFSKTFCFLTFHSFSLTLSRSNSHTVLVFSVYQKFRETYTSIDFCGLTGSQKKILCDKVLSDAEYGLDPNTDFASQVGPCYRQRVALTSFEAEKLQTEKFSMWACPPSSTSPNRVPIYYMGKSHLRDAAFLYRDVFYGRKRYQMNAIHPVTLILHINRYQLAIITQENE